MNGLHQLGVQLVWVVVQVTLFLVLGTLLYAAMRRRGPAVRALLAGGTLTISLVLAGFALSPWPRWWSVSFPTSTPIAINEEASQERTAEGEQAASEDRLAADGRDKTGRSLIDNGAPADGQLVARNADLEDPQAVAFAAFWKALEENLKTPSPADVAHPRWPLFAVLAVVFLAGAGLGLARILVGVWAVARFRKRAVPITDAQLLRELKELRAAIGCSTAVAVCESATIGTPATVGWRRPLILLPSDWREWDAVDRRAVLAHELAHVARGDYLSGLVARLSTAVHFYHPLAHWLARQMRFEQELAADACGVECSGGNESYVVALARMALHQDNRMLAWAARPFLPSRSTFLRRIEMLRNTQRVQNLSFTPSTRRLLMASLAGLALVIVGLRGPGVLPGSGDEVAAQDRPAADAATESAKLDLKNVPEDTVAYAVIRPAAILQQSRELQNLAAELEKQFELSKHAHLRPEEVQEVRLLAIDIGPIGEEGPGMAAVFRTTNDAGLKKLMEEGAKTVEDRYGGQTFRRPAEGHRVGSFSYWVDENTLVVASNEAAVRAMIDARKSEELPRWAEEFKRVEGTEAAFALDVKWLGKIADQQLQRQGAGPDAAMVGAMSGLWRQTNVAVGGIEVDDKITARAYAICKSEEGAEEVKETIIGVRILMQNMVLQTARRELAPASATDEMRELTKRIFDEMDKFLSQVKPQREGKVVTVEVKGPEALGPFVGSVVLPAVAKARGAAQRAHSVNNLKQLALAMHVYADVHKAFPPAVLLGPDGKTPHSWRVAILPFIEQEKLYREYNLNEPWDSENNKKVLAKMPALFKHPATHEAGGGSTNSAYYILTNEKGIFSAEAKKQGTGFAEIRDGTSTTLLMVEARRDIPWTKPEDIPIDSPEVAPKLGGFSPDGFNAALADGSVRMMPANFSARQLWEFMTRSGGEAVELPGFGPPGAAGAQPPGRAAPRRQ